VVLKENNSLKPHKNGEKKKPSAIAVVKEIPRRTERIYSAEEKIS